MRYVSFLALLKISGRIFRADFRFRSLLPHAKLFRRIMASAKRKERHRYRVSYQLDVGSSLDPDMEDVEEWERELIGAGGTRPSI